MAKYLILFLFLFFLMGCPKEPHLPSNPSSTKSPPPAKTQKTAPLLWLSWSEEAFWKGQKEKKFICLYLYKPWSFWCQKFEKTYFRDPQVISSLQSFVPVKANGLIFPELESAYGQKGLPALAFFTDKGELFGLFFGYQSREKLLEFLQKVQNLYQRPEVLTDRLARIRKKKEEGEKQRLSVYPAPGDIKETLLKDHLEYLEKNFDPYFGGFGKGLKRYHFPTDQLLLFCYGKDQIPQYLHMVKKNLLQVERSPVYDRLGGGFHRLSSSRSWDNPFFEKTLEGNADFVRAYALLYLLKGEEHHKKMGEETLGFVKKFLKAPGGGYYVGLNCGLGGEDYGKTYTWTKGQIQELMDSKTARVLDLYYGLEWGQSASSEDRPLGINRGVAEMAQLLGWTEREVRERLVQGIGALKKKRLRRKSPPPIPLKTIASQAWMALAFFDAYRAWGDESNLQEGLEIVNSLKKIQRKSGGLPNLEDRYILGDQTRSALAFLAAYSLTGKRDFFDGAEGILQEILRKAPANQKYGGFVFGWGQSGPVAPSLKRVDFYENSFAAYLCMVLYHYIKKEPYRQEALKIFQLLGNFHTVFGQFGSPFNLALQLYFYTPPQVLLVRGKAYGPSFLRESQRTSFPVVVRFLSSRALARRLPTRYKASDQGYVISGRKVLSIQSERDFGPFWKSLQKGD